MADVGVLLALRRQLWDDYDTPPANLAALLARDDFAAFIALDGEAPVGFVEVTLRRYIDGAPDTANGFLEGVFVADHCRRAGIASLLAAAAAEWARANGATHLGSNTDEANIAGASWHRALGFVEVGRTVNFAKPL